MAWDEEKAKASADAFLQELKHLTPEEQETAKKIAGLWRNRVSTAGHKKLYKALTSSIDE